jgi:hypothetical protein
MHSPVEKERDEHTGSQFVLNAAFEQSYNAATRESRFAQLLPVRREAWDEFTPSRRSPFVNCHSSWMSRSIVSNALFDDEVCLRSKTDLA